MRIFSSFHDYYDCILSHGQDTDVIYVRKTKKESYTGPELPFSRTLDSRKNHTHSYVETEFIGFCGRIYPVLSIYIEGRRYPYTLKSKDDLCMNLEDVDAVMEKYCSKKGLDTYYQKKSYLKNAGNCPVRRKTFQEFFATCDKQKDSYKQFFLDNRCPIWHVAPPKYRNENPEITWNPCLKEWDFYRVFDPYTAFQELSMFLGNLATPVKEIPDLPDEIMAEIKGFDEWSFRQPPKK